MSYTLEDLLRAAGAPAPDRAEALWARYRETGDDAAFATLVGWYGAGVYRRVLFRVGFAHPLAEEAFQAALAKLHAHRHSRVCATFAGALAWLRTTAANEARMAARAHRRAKARDAAAAIDPAAAAAPPADDEVLRVEQLAELAAAFGRLRADQQEALALRVFEGLTLARAAEAAGCNRETLARRVEQGLDRLRALLTARGVLPAGAGAAAAGAVLAGAARAVPPAVRIATMTAAARLAKPLAGGGRAKKAAVLLGATAAGGLAVGGWLWAGDADDSRPTPGPAAAPAAGRPAPVESLEARNRRVLEAETLPRVVEALRPMALNGGEARVARLDVYDFRAVFDVELRHGPGPARPAPTRVRVFLDTRTGNGSVLCDPWGRGRFRDVDVDRPIVLFRVPELKVEAVLRPGPLTAAVAALKAFPPDPRAAAAADRHAAAVRAALAPYRGAWLYHGAPARRSTFGTLPADGPDAKVDVPEVGGPVFPTVLQLAVEPDGRLRPWSRDEPYTLTDGGRRLDRPGTADWWVRPPGGP